MVWIWDKHIKAIIIQQPLENHTDTTADTTHGVRSVVSEQHRQNPDKKYPVVNMNGFVGKGYLDRPVMKNRIHSYIDSWGLFFFSEHQQRINTRHDQSS